MTAFLLFIFWRVGLFTAAFVANIVLPFIPRFPYSDVLLIPSGLPQWLWSFANFDGVHYITIAKSGYSAQFTQVFFPLYPILVRFISVVFNKNYILSGLFISNASFIISLYLFIKLLKKDGFEKSAYWIVLFVLTFPFSFFFGSLYTESLFFLFVLASFLAARNKKWILAGIFGGLASATRIAGIFLLPALLYEWQQSNIRNWKLEIGNLKAFIIKFRQILRSPILYFTPIGLVFYMVYLQWKFNDALYFWHGQGVFGAERSGSTFISPPQVLWRYSKIFATVPLSTYDFWVAFWELASFIFVVAILIIAHKKHIRLSYLIFSWLAVLVPALTGTFSSMPRYILIAFPIYIVLGMIKDKVIKTTILLLQVTMLVLFTIIFINGQWVA